jgi:hypothetical protein
VSGEDVDHSPAIVASATDVRRGAERDPGELDQLVFGVDHSYGTPSASSLEARELFKARHALLIAPPGMGKSELFAHVAREDGALPVLVLKASGIAAELDPARSPAQVFAAALLRGAWASTEGVPRPTLEALRSGPLAFLVDGFDEVRQGRGAVAEVIAEAASEWPQHHVVVASRPVPECRDLIADGFAPYRLWPSNGWAKEYLNARSVENDARTKMEQARGFDDLIAIPLFAKPIADRLLSGELPERPLDLLVDAQRVAAAREEEREVIDGSLFDWLCGLAVALVLRAAPRRRQPSSARWRATALSALRSCASGSSGLHFSPNSRTSLRSHGRRALRARDFRAARRRCGGARDRHRRHRRRVRDP